jgi:hypothetical protein
MSEIDVTVVMATYNHAPYVGEAIRSVLAQRGVRFELLIADDGSKDDTSAVVRTIDDPRIRFQAHAVNRGACITTNELIRQARGRYVALINSDDRWIGDHKLFEQVKLLDENPNIGASFGRARYIDQLGKAIDKADLPFGSVFDEHNRSRGQWLRRFFDFGNCLLHPSLLIRTSCYEELGLYDNRYRQLPDFDMWVRLIKRHDIHVSASEYVEFRVLPGENASAQSLQNTIRVINEHHLIARHFFDGVSAADLKDGFGDQVSAAVQEPGCLEIEAALLLLGAKGTFNRDLASAYAIVALEQLFELLGDERTRELMAQHYGINDLWLQARMSEVAVFTYRAQKVKRTQRGVIAMKKWLNNLR